MIGSFRDVFTVSVSTPSWTRVGPTSSPGTPRGGGGFSQQSFLTRPKFASLELDPATESFRNPLAPSAPAASNRCFFLFSHLGSFPQVAGKRRERRSAAARGLEVRFFLFSKICLFSKNHLCALTKFCHCPMGSAFRP